MGGAFGPAHCSFVGFTALRSFPRNRNAPKNTGSFLPFFSLLFRSSSPFFSLLEPFPASLCLLLYLPLFLNPRVFSVSLCLPLYLPLPPFSRPSIWLIFFISPLGGKDQAQPKILLRISSTIERNLRSVSIRLATALHEWSTVEWSRPAICAPMCCKE